MKKESAVSAMSFLGSVKNKRDIQIKPYGSKINQSQWLQKYAYKQTNFKKVLKQRKVSCQFNLDNSFDN